MKPIAKFLVLLGDAPRAFLFDGTQQLLGEVIEDDGYIVDHLVGSALACPLPHDRMLDAVLPRRPPQGPVRCFELG